MLLSECASAFCLSPTGDISIMPPGLIYGCDPLNDSSMTPTELPGLLDPLSGQICDDAKGNEEAGPELDESIPCDSSYCFRKLFDAVISFSLRNLSFFFL